MDIPNCSRSKLTHAMVIIGYGSGRSKDYWLLKNRYNYIERGRDAWLEREYHNILYCPAKQSSLLSFPFFSCPFRLLSPFPLSLLSLLSLTHTHSLSPSSFPQQLGS